MASHHSPSAALALNVKRLRDELEISQAELSEMTGIDPADISRIENGHATANIGLERITKLAEALGTSASALLSNGGGA